MLVVKPRRNQKLQPVTKPAAIAGELRREPNSVVRNPHKVSKRQWGKWSDRARRAFNSMYSYMDKNQIILTHPNMSYIHDDHWGDEAVGPYKPGKPAKNKMPSEVVVYDFDGGIRSTSA
jgi:hypothetical protein